MGFQTADVLPLARDVRELPGVTGVWVLPGSDDRGCLMWVAVAGLDSKGSANRMGVHEHIGNFVDKNRFDMQFSNFLFDFTVAVDEPDLGPIQLPPDAISISVA